MSDPKFVDELPVARRGGPRAAWIFALRERPGQWAEIQRYAIRQSAHSRGNQSCRRHADLEYAVRTIAGEHVLFMRAKS